MFVLIYKVRKIEEGFCPLLSMMLFAALTATFTAIWIAISVT